MKLTKIKTLLTEGVQPHPDNVKAIANVPRLHDFKTVRRFIIMTSYVSKKATLVMPLEKLTG